MDEILVYSAPWCGDCRVAKRIFEEYGLDYKLVNVDNDMEAQRRVQEINNGYRSIPTILFPSGRVVVEPTGPELILALRDEGLIPTPG
jgi:mycoredoxin